MILCLVLRLCSGSGYPHYILTNAAQLDDDNETVQSKFYSLYDQILNYWFPPTEGYDVSPHWYIPGSKKPPDFIAFVIEHHHHPLLLVEIKPPSDFPFDSGRSVAINQIIQRIDELGPDNQYVDRLYA